MPSSLKVLFRYLRNHPLVSGINIAGLSLGLTAGIIALIFVSDELSYDKFHEKKDRLYRVVSEMYDPNTGEDLGGPATNGWPVGHRLRNYPEVEASVNIRRGTGYQIKHNGENYQERFYFAGQEFLQMFTFPLIKGNPETALSEPWSLVITEELEKKYFGDESALGKSFILSDTLNFNITGVMKDIPRQSHMRFSMLASFSTYPLINTNFTTDWGFGNFQIRNYVLLREGTDFAAFNEKARNVVMDEAGEQFLNMGMEVYQGFEPMGEIYLGTDHGNGMGPQGSYDRLYLIATISLFIVIIACINFVNLSTARSVNRAKEVGLRKVIGSNRLQLVRQFVLESFLLTLLSFLIAIGLADLAFPFFNGLLDKQLSLMNLLNPMLGIGALLLIPIVTLLAGYYPALVLSGYKPSDVLKGKMVTSFKGVQLRKGLTIFQFMLSITLIIGTLMISDQLRYMQSQDLGFDHNKVIVLNTWQIPSLDLARAAETFQREIEELPGVEYVSRTWATPGRAGWRGQWAFPEGFPDGENVTVEYVAADYNYIKTLDLQIIAGSDFNPDKASDLESGLVLNETAVELMRFGTPIEAIGKTITSPSGHPAGTVIGVVKDYHQRGLQSRIPPIVIDHYPDLNRYFAIEAQGLSEEWLSQLNDIWAKHFVEYPLNYSFLDDDFQRQYSDEESYAHVFTAFAAVAIFIAVIGLFGLVAFIVTSRSKEIGVRKVLGASETRITYLLSKDFLILLVIAMVITIPLAYYLAEQWLDSFAFRTTIGPAVFILGFLITFAVTFVTIGFQTIKAAKANPVDTLRME